MKTVPAESDKKPSSPDTWVDWYGDYLYRYARTRVQNPSAAEDLVQETFLAALRSHNTFQGRSSEKTWMTGILKHKIIDHFRKTAKEHTEENIDSHAALTDDIFDDRGKWKIKPVKWRQDAHQLFEQKEFMAVLSVCLSQLSSTAANVFVLREMDGESTEKICKVLEISATNCWVILHRARGALRRCLEKKWFTKPAKKGAG
jgi:RNA polymerase sigma-70 factor (TIGR02943 family)